MSRPPDLPAERERHQLHAVADAEHGHVEIEQRQIALWCALVIDAAGSTRQDDPRRTLRADVVKFSRELPAPGQRQERLLDPVDHEIIMIGSFGLSLNTVGSLTSLVADIAARGSARGVALEKNATPARFRRENG